jgi:hypothetical protein
VVIRAQKIKRKSRRIRQLSSNKNPRMIHCRRPEAPIASAENTERSALLVIGCEFFGPTDKQPTGLAARSGAMPADAMIRSSRL